MPDIDYIKRILLSIRWLFKNYLRFTTTLRKEYDVKRIRIHSFSKWHGHACYFKAHYNGSRVFIKTLKSEFEILQNEDTAIRVLSQNANMQYLPKVFLHGQVGVDDFIMLEDISGNTLDYHLKNRMSEINASERIKIATGLIGILEELHKNQVVHRDLKPDNVFIRLNRGVNLTLIDFTYVVDSTNWSSKPRFRDINHHKHPMDIWKALGEDYKPGKLKWDDAFAIHKILDDNNHLFNLDDELLQGLENKIGLEIFVIKDNWNSLTN